MEEETKQDAARAIDRRDLFTAAALAGLLASGKSNAAEVLRDAKSYGESMVSVLDGHEAQP